MKLVLFRIVTAVLLVTLMITVFNLSGQTATESADLSGSFTFKVFSVIYPGFKSFDAAKQAEIISDASHFIRKTAHFSLYFIMGVLSFLTVITYKKIPYCVRPGISFVICVLYSVSDEIHQRFIPGRSGELRDVLIDSSGALSAILFLVLVCGLSKKLKSILR